MAIPRLRRRACRASCLLLAVAMVTGTATVCLLLKTQPSSSSSGCAETLMRLMATDGWQWRSGHAASSYVMELSSEADKQAATLACVQRREPAPAAESQLTVEKPCFAEKLSHSVRQKCTRHLDIVASALEQAGIEYYLDMGTALGAHRHLDMIPYDEDVDIRINAAQKMTARRALMRLRDDWPRQLLFQDTEWQNQHWKVHFLDTMDPVLERHVAMDVFFYTLNASLNRVLISEQPFSFPVGDIFPLLLRPIRRRLYPTPNSIDAMITGYFANTSLTDCVYYLHDLPPFSPECERPVVPCSQLRHRFSFTQTLQLPQQQQQQQQPIGQVQFLTEPAASVADGGGDSSSAVTWVAFIAGATRL